MKTRTLQVMMSVAVICTMAHASVWYGADDSAKAATGNWDSDGKPGWNGTGVPNGVGAVAYFSSTKKNTIYQNITAGVTIGSLVLDLPDNVGLDLSVSVEKINNVTTPGPIIFDQDGAGPGMAVISNSAARARIGIGGSNPITLNDDILLINTSPDTYTRSYSISETSTIGGSGNVIIDNALDLPRNGPIQLNSSASTFVGSVFVRRGCVKFIGTKACGALSNVVTLGATGYGDATICFEGSAAVFSNPIVVSKVAGGRLRIYGEATQNEVKQNCQVTLKGAITLNGDVVFDIPLKPNPSYDYTSQEIIDAVISGDGSATKEGDGPLVFKKANTYTGGTVLKEGTLSLTGAGTLGSGALDVYDGATLDLSVDATVATLSINGKLQPKGVYAAADSAASGVKKVAWITGAGTLTAVDGKRFGMVVYFQ